MRFTYPEIPDPNRPMQEKEEPVATVTTVSHDEPVKEDMRHKPRRKGGQLAASIISWVMVPLVMPVVGILLILTLSSLSSFLAATRWVVGLVILGLNTVLPAILIYILKTIGIVRDIGLNNRSERLYPYLITIVALGCSGFYLSHTGAPVWCSWFYYGGAVAAVANCAINSVWKISAHAASAAGVIALTVVIASYGSPVHPMMPWILGSVLLTGLLGTARVYLGRHTPLQVICGYIVGFCCSYFMTVIFA